jgi:A/G-specific adenine glycosylase
MPVIFLETNIRRVFIHFFFSETDTVSDAEILLLVERALYRKNPRVWYWALMDLGTALKKTVPNPNRRSVHYSKQAAFEGSDRKIRGMILRLLVSYTGMHEEEIAGHFSEDRTRIMRIIGALEKEGFIVRDGHCLKLSS